MRIIYIYIATCNMHNKLMRAYYMRMKLRENLSEATYSKIMSEMQQVNIVRNIS